MQNNIFVKITLPDTNRVERGPRLTEHPVLVAISRLQKVEVLQISAISEQFSCFNKVRFDHASPKRGSDRQWDQL